MVLGAVCEKDAVIEFEGRSVTVVVTSRFLGIIAVLQILLHAPALPVVVGVQAVQFGSAVHIGNTGPMVSVPRHRNQYNDTG